MKSILLHDTNFTAAEFADIGKSGLHVKTEKFYLEYGITKAIYYYTNQRFKLMEEYGKHYLQSEGYKDAVDMVVKLYELKKQTS